MIGIYEYFFLIDFLKNSTLLSKTPNWQSLYKVFQLLLFISIIAVIAYFACLLVSKPLLILLYPEWALESLEIIRITTATAMMSLMVSIVNPIVLRFCKIDRQIIINFISLTVYLFSCLIFMKLYGLPGFAFGVLLAYAIKLLVLVLIFLLDYRPNQIERT